MSFYGDLPTETRKSDAGAEYTVKVDPTKAKNKVTDQPGPITSTSAKGEAAPAADVKAK